jgi:hypothetical protein
MLILLCGFHTRCGKGFCGTTLFEAIQTNLEPYLLRLEVDLSGRPRSRFSRAPAGDFYPSSLERRDSSRVATAEPRRCACPIICRFAKRQSAALWNLARWKDSNCRTFYMEATHSIASGVVVVPGYR